MVSRYTAEEKCGFAAGGAIGVLSIGEGVAEHFYNVPAAIEYLPALANGVVGAAAGGGYMAVTGLVIGGIGAGLISLATGGMFGLDDVEHVAKRTAIVAGLAGCIVGGAVGTGLGELESRIGKELGAGAEYAYNTYAQNVRTE